MLGEATQTRLLCILLIVQAMVSFRSVPRILKLYQDQGYADLGWVPHFSSVINWTLRYGLSLLQGVKRQKAPWIAIIDHSIEVGVNKVLVVLRVDVEALGKRGSPIRREDCECVGLQISEQSDGETVYEQLKAIFARCGEPKAILKDGDTGLGKGVRLWREREGKKGVWVLEDIGHVMANALNSQYARGKCFQRFLSIIHRGSARLRQTEWAFLVPPKLRTKGRFQGISALGKWAQRMLHALAGKDDDDTRGVLATLRSAMAGLSGLRTFIERFATTVLTVVDVLTVLKHHGINQASYRQCRELAQRLPPRSVAKKRLDGWLKRHLYIQGRLGIGQTPLLVSSDIIESLFGTFKHILARSPQADMSRTVLIIPALCGQAEPLLIAQALADTTHRDLQRWEQQQVPETIRRKRNDFFNNDGYQKLGNNNALAIP